MKRPIYALTSSLARFLIVLAIFCTIYLIGHWLSQAIISNFSDYSQPSSPLATIGSALIGMIMLAAMSIVVVTILHSFIAGQRLLSKTKNNSVEPTIAHASTNHRELKIPNIKNNHGKSKAHDSDIDSDDLAELYSEKRVSRVEKIKQQGTEITTI